MTSAHLKTSPTVTSPTDHHVNYNKIGDSLSIECKADGVPPPEITWTKKEKIVSTGPVLNITKLEKHHEEGDLSLRAVRKSDRGWYVCKAHSPSGEQSKVSAFLDVLYAPEPLPSHRPVLTIGYGQNGTISCAMDGNPKPTHYTWSKNGHFISTTSEESLTIRTAKDSDGGIFGCQAENSIGRSTVLETHVIIAEPPVFITRPPPELRVFEGAPANVVCDGFGDPLPIVYWVHSERTRPQSAIIDSVECIGDEAMMVNWTPGFNGSYLQSFVVHYSSDDDPTEKSLLTTSHSATIGDLKAFSKYRIHVESRNQKGSTNSSAVEKHVCSTLPSPLNIRFSGESELRWDPVEVAKSYRVESRNDKMSAFEGIGEVFDPLFRMRPQFRQGQSFRVRSLRDAYEPSLPSRTITYGSTGYGPPSMWWAVFGGVLFFFIFLFLYMYSRYGKYITRQRKKDMRYNDYVCPSSFQPHSETMYAASMNPTESTKSAHWHNSKDESLIGDNSQVMLEYCYVEESNSAVDDMLRDKYLYGAEDVPVQLMNDLRIEKLRREFKQSQL
ncbi:hypothetical protein RB195_026169 [Necator americanus]|uniref:Fibronectin type III domain protein n=1 Tax=Necator americanus TaxID=51031 RepID=A0ABR1EVW0_NECAM